MYPLGILNQLKGIPLNKQIWFNFWNSASEPGDSGIFTNAMGTSITYSPTVFADGTNAGNVDLSITKSATGTTNFGASSPTPRDFNQICYTFRNHVINNIDNIYDIDVYLILDLPFGGDVLTYNVQGGESGNVPIFYPINPNLDFEEEFKITVPAGSRLTFGGGGNTHTFGIIIVVKD